MSVICPLGLCRTEQDCPNAPCVDCMRRLGEHMIEEVGVMSRQAKAAHDKGDKSALSVLQKMFSDLGLHVSIRELTSEAQKLSTQLSNLGAQ